MNARTTFRSAKLPLILGLGVAVMSLAGCQGTLHTRWAQTGDTYDYWSGRMDSLPLEVHGQVADEALKDVPGATNAAAFAKANPNQAALAAQERVVVYLGGNEQPTNASYCSADPNLHEVPVKDEKKDGTMVAAALCDGPRLVVRMRRELDDKAVAARSLPWTMASVKHRLLFGVRVSQAQTPDPQTNG